MKVVALIPAYNPDNRLVSVVKDLITYGFEKIVIVNDGSNSHCKEIFEALEDLNQCHVMSHAVNLGKGAALKTGFNHILVHYPEALSIVSADADGQHAPRDVMRVAQSAIENPGNLVLGARMFGKGVPLRSLFGNQFTRLVMRLFTGMKLADTQTGLRAWPRSLCMEMLKVPINGYDFEMEGLVRAKQCLAGVNNVLEVPIETIYEVGNKSSHFNPLFDSMRIYFVFMRYAGTAITASLLDYVLFAAFYTMGRNILLSLIAARSIAVSAAYVMARNIVFKSTSPARKTIQLYVLAVIGYMLISYGSIHFLNSSLGLHPVAAKLVTEGIMFFASFAVQRDFIFKERRKNKDV